MGRANKKKGLALKPDERVVTAFARPASGPGWSNRPVIAIVIDGNGRMREEFLQPDEQTDDMMTLYAVSDAVNVAMTTAVIVSSCNRTARK